MKETRGVPDRAPILVDQQKFNLKQWRIFLHSDNKSPKDFSMLVNGRPLPQVNGQ